MSGCPARLKQKQKTDETTEIRVDKKFDGPVSKLREEVEGCEATGKAIENTFTQRWVAIGQRRRRQ